MDLRDDLLRVLVIGGDRLARLGLVRSLAETESVVADRGGDADVASLTATLGATVVLWDLGEGPVPRPDRVEKLSAPALALVSSAEASQEALANGFSGAIHRDVDLDALPAALRAVVAGFVVQDRRVVDRPARLGPAADLTPRETEVLGLLAEGLSNREVGVRLGMSAHTAKFHVNAILGKLGARTRAEAVAIAARSGRFEI